MELKICTKCHEPKDALREFPKDPRLISGLSSQCRKCHAIRSARSYAANKDICKERSKAWRLANAERHRELAIQSRLRTRPNISEEEWAIRKAASKERKKCQTRKAMSFRWHNDPNHRQARRIYMNERRLAERRVRERSLLQADIARIQTEGVTRKRSRHAICPVVRLNSVLYADAKKSAKLERQARRDPAKVRASVRRWKKENPAAVSIQRFRRRVNFQNAEANLTETQWRTIKAAYNFRCAYCGQKKPLTQDHVVPVSKGGHHIASNIIPACRSCNSSKGARLPVVSYQPHLIV